MAQYDFFVSFFVVFFVHIKSCFVLFLLYLLVWKEKKKEKSLLPNLSLKT